MHLKQFYVEMAEPKISMTAGIAGLATANPSAEIESFVREIVNGCVQEDTLSQQQTKYGKVLSRPLPIDSYSEVADYLITGLLDTIGDDYNELYSLLSSMTEKDKQSRNLIVAAAATGLGKTHAAYAVGASKAPTILIRVALSDTDMDGHPNLSRPWQNLDELYTPLLDVLERIESLPSVLATLIAQNAASLMEALLFTFIAVNLDVIDIIIKDSVGGTPSRELVRRVLLYFNRNGRCERLVSAKFNNLIREHCSVTEIEVAPGKLLPSSFVSTEVLNGLRKALITRIEANKEWLCEPGSTPLLVIALDEASALIGRWKGLFRNEETVSLTDSTPDSRDYSAARDGFYMLGRLGAKLLSSSYFTVLCTGTLFSMEVFESDCDWRTHGRNIIQHFCPKTLLTVEHMQEYLLKYFKDEHEVLKRPEMVELLNRAVGRPLFFFERIFRSTVTALGQLETPADTLPSELLHRVWKKELDDEVQLWWQRSSAILSNGGVPVPLISSENTDKLLVPLAMTIFRGDYKLEVDDMPLARAFVACGFAPAQVPIAYTKSEFDLSKEPLVKEPLLNVATQQLKVPNYLVHCRLSSTASRSETGFVAEDAIALNFCARTFGEATHSMKLFDLLLPLCDTNEGKSLLEEVTSEWLTEAYIPVDASASDNPLREFLDEDGKVQTKKFLYNINKQMGPDIAFVAYRVDAAGDRTYKLIVGQMKNQAAGTVYEASITLAAGSWFLTDHVRKELSEVQAGGAIKETVAPSSPTTVWISFCEWLANAPMWLRDGYLRLAFVANASVEAKLLLMLNNSSKGKLPEELLHTITSSSIRTKLQEAAAENPLVVLSMRSTHFVASKAWFGLLPDKSNVMSLPELPHYNAAVLAPPSLATALKVVYTRKKWRKDDMTRVSSIKNRIQVLNAGGKFFDELPVDVVVEAAHVLSASSESVADSETHPTLHTVTLPRLPLPRRAKSSLPVTSSRTATSSLPATSAAKRVIPGKR